jgi:lysophospholipase L1-like esterase
MLSKALPILSLALLLTQASAMTANPLLSRGKSMPTSRGEVSYLTDNRFMGSAFNVSDGAWIAIRVGPGPTRLFVNWNSPADYWSNRLTAASCPRSNPLVVDYEILRSSNSTNGSDGAWTVAASVTGNYVTARGHLIDFEGSSWVKMSIKRGGGSLDEFEVFDASKGADDTWFFPGTSITQGAFKGYATSPGFADRVAASHPGFNPAVIRGGIGCVNSGDMVRNLGDYLAAARNARYWAIEMGTNDAWGGSNANVAAFTGNLQRIIDSCKAAGITPVLARILATNPARTNGWQVHGDYLKAVDDLRSRNNLPAGPDLFAWFKAHPEELGQDGVHPNAAGAASIQRLWAEAASSLYSATRIGSPAPSLVPGRARGLEVMIRGGRLDLRASMAGAAYVHGIDGRLLERVLFTSAGRAQRSWPSGLFFVRFATPLGTETVLLPGR